MIFSGVWATEREISAVATTPLASVDVRVKATGELVTAVGVPLIVAVEAVKLRPAGSVPVRA